MHAAAPNSAADNGPTAALAGLTGYARLLEATPKVEDARERADVNGQARTAIAECVEQLRRAGALD